MLQQTKFIDTMRVFSSISKANLQIITGSKLEAE